VSADRSPAAGQVREADDTIGSAPTDLDNRVNAGWVTMKIQAQYFGDEAVKGRRIDVDTSQAGRVTLKGEVETEAARQRAVQIARTTEGVTDVVDQLTVTGADVSAVADADDGERGLDVDLGDPWVTAKIKSKYFLDDEVKGLSIDVTTAEGIVTLTGEVATPAERRQAVALARATDGVADVRDQLRVTGDAQTVAGAPAAAENRTAAAAPPVDDDWIETRIHSRYFMDNELKFGDIEVSSDSGDVIIEGQVSSEDAKEKAEEIARETSGVAEVINRLAVSVE
jgi:osmotically-inducible protein OsmY